MIRIVVAENKRALIEVVETGERRDLGVVLADFYSGHTEERSWKCRSEKDVAECRAVILFLEAAAAELRKAASGRLE